MTEDSSLRKVVVHTRKGEIIHGFANQDLIKTSVKVITRQGKQRTFKVQQIKAVFFVKDFDGDPEYAEVKFMTKEPNRSTIWARVQFQDGEIQEGKIPNNVELLNEPGFFLWPLDRDTNNELIYVSKACLKDFSILHTS